MLDTGLGCVVRTAQEAQQTLHFTIMFPELQKFSEITEVYVIASVVHKLRTHCWAI